MLSEIIVVSIDIHFLGIFMQDNAMAITGASECGKLLSYTALFVHHVHRELSMG